MRPSTRRAAPAVPYLAGLAELSFVSRDDPLHPALLSEVARLSRRSAAAPAAAPSDGVASAARASAAEDWLRRR